MGPLLSFLCAIRHNSGELIKGGDAGEHRGNQGAGTSSVGHHLRATRGETLQQVRRVSSRFHRYVAGLHFRSSIALDALDLLRFVFPELWILMYDCLRSVFIIQAYGAVLSPMPGGDKEQGNLSRALGSVVGTACLRTEEHVGPQLTSHVFGLLKARNVKGLSEEDYWLATDEGTEWVIRTVDEIMDVVKSDTSSAPGAKL